MRVIARAIGGILLLIAVAPVLVAIAPAFRDPASEQWTSSAFTYVFQTYGASLRLSLIVSSIVVAGSLVIGVPAAIAFALHPSRFARTLERVVELPLALPGVSIAIAVLLTWVHHRETILLLCGAIMLYTIPYVVRIVGNGFDVPLHQELDDAARTLGAGRWKRFRSVTMSLLRGPIVLAALVTFALAWGEFNVSFLLATPLQATFSASLYGAFTSNSAEVAGAALLIFVTGALPFLIAFHFAGRELVDAGQKA
jgi:putative spermidine/putrescine transport system permease protein